MIANKLFPKGLGQAVRIRFGIGIVVNSPHNRQTVVSQKYNQEYDSWLFSSSLILSNKLFSREKLIFF